MGYPGIDLDEIGEEVDGFLFTSENHSKHGAKPDKFEGESYERVMTVVAFQDNSIVDTYIYTLA